MFKRVKMTTGKQQIVGHYEADLKGVIMKKIDKKKMKIFVTLGSPCATSLVRKTSKGCATVDERHPASPPHTKCVTVL